MTARCVGRLPAEVTSFVGRERALGQVRRLLSAGRLVTLTGPGGVGKTRLARRVAAEVRRAFPDGVWLVELAELREGDLLAYEVAAMFGLKDASGNPAASLAEYLRDKNLLLLLDNCEHLIHPVVALVNELLTSAPALRVLTTSRQVLGSDGEHLFEVPPLSLPETDLLDLVRPSQVTSEAVDLFLDRAAAVVPELPEGPEFQRSVRELCLRLDGIPLAIELAAARMRAYPVEEILARVEHALDVLTTGPRSAPPRHRALKATIGWSFGLCSPEEQLMWARLSVFAGGFDLNAAEGVCTDVRLPRAQVFDLLASLVDKSILQREGGSARFSMLETVREYGREHLVALGEEKELRVRHAEHFAALADRGRSDYFSEREIRWFQEVGLNHANIRLAMQFCLAEGGEPRIALRIAARLRMYWSKPSVIMEGYQWLRKALDSSPEASEERADALWACAYIEVLLTEVERAARTMGECRALAGKLALHRVEAALTLCPILADFVLGDVAAALRHAKEAIACGREADDPTVTGEALFFAAAMAFASGDPGAERLADEALRFLEAEHSQLWRANALWINGVVRCRAADRDAATACFLDAIVLFRQLGHDVGLALALDGLAWVAACSGELSRAARLLGAADPIWKPGPRRMMPFEFSEFAVKGKVEAIVRAGISEASFEAAVQDGSARPLDDVLGEIAGMPLPASEPRRAAREDPLTVLSPRERKVAELLAKGMSNQDIATDLVLSRRTVESHVQHILTKLGFHSRTQVASWVSRMESADRPTA
ncbi:LuxR C-terminal-related transcriptional regulator (plasmid) [Streptomyces sp. NBC_01450]|uniref:ATP-binding protein n=1 Tax=Streptomyces sp. NBC_01450 TaxID=2903871 RepID=UPI002E376A18|nr:LuxR C-terminal-related transcriptional regulator [Streptomyces sp. NBC_01450]